MESKQILNNNYNRQSIFLHALLFACVAYLI